MEIINNILISIIIPAYNSEKFIGQCITSILKQDFDSFEIIAVNDCSNDLTLQILDNFEKQDKRLKIINNVKNMGRSQSRNLGLKNARGKYILFVDSDDWLEPGTLSKLFRCIVDRNADVCIYGLKSYDENSKQYIENKYYDLDKMAKRVGKGCSFKSIIDQLFMRFGCFLKLYKRHLIFDNNILFPEQEIGEDVLFHIKSLVYAKKIYVLNEKLYNYRIHSESTMRKIFSEEQAKDIIKYYKDILDFFEINNIFEIFEADFVKFVLQQYNHYKKQENIDFKFINYLNRHIKNFIKFNNKISRTGHHPDVSIIISSYNGEKTLSNAIISALAQKNCQVEVLCIDDGSNDESSNLIKIFSYKNKNFTGIIQANKGLSAARNIALKVASGKYVQFLDSDDYLNNNTCEKLLNFSEKHNTDLCSFSGYNIFNGKKRINGYWDYHNIPAKFKNAGFNSNEIIDHIFYLPVSSCITIYNNKFLKSINNKFPVGYYFEDNYFFTNAFLNSNRYGILNHPFYNRIIHQNQITKRTDRILFDLFYIYEKVFEIYLKHLGREFSLNYLNKIIQYLHKKAHEIDKDLKSEFCVGISKFISSCTAKLNS